jgi:hypothetical protein
MQFDVRLVFRRKPRVGVIHGQASWSRRSTRQQPARVPSQSTIGGHDRCHRQHDAADAEPDRKDVPQRAPIIQEWEIKTVETVIQPTIHAADALVLHGNDAVLRIDVHPRPLRIGKAHAKHGEGSDCPSIVVVRVVSLQPLRVLHSRMTFHRQRSLENRVTRKRGKGAAIGRVQKHEPMIDRELCGVNGPSSAVKRGMR